jgi:TolB-like protein
MKKMKLRFVKPVMLFVVLLILPALAVCATGAKEKESDNSEVIVQRVDNNNLIRLRVYIDGKVAGTLRVGETSKYKIKNGPHTIRAAPQDYEARSTEVSQFVANNSRIVFNITDESIVAMAHEKMDNAPKKLTPVLDDDDDSTIETAIVNAFDKVSKDLDKNKKVAIINVDSDDKGEADYILEELTYLYVHSKKNFEVIDRRGIDAFRGENGIGVPSYNNDYMLRLIGELMGADFVISGRLGGDGDLRRLRVKAIDVKTGRLVGNSSERV